jgi:Ribose/xylose/arabinose/galactoside ABC-type transport systems, permease components
MTTITVRKPQSPLRARVRDVLVRRPIFTLSAVLIILYVVAGMRDPTLFSPNGIRSILLLACPLALLAASETVCMLTAGIDLSITMIANLAAYLAAINSGAGPLQSIGIGLLVGLVVGAINGIGVGVFKVDSLIMTLGMSSVLVGIVTVGIVGNGFLVGATNILPAITTVGSGTLFGPIPMNATVWLVVAAVLIFLLSRTGLGRMIYAVGDNPIACRLAGVKVWKVLIAVYMIAGVLAAIAGLMYSGISGSVGPDQTSSFLLPAIAAAVIGGTSILGGVGGYTGAIFGALILTVLNSMLLTLNTSEAVRQIVYGAIILVLAWVYVRLTGQKVS